MQQPPPGWSKDKLSAFIDVATENTFATFHNKKKEYDLLRKIDDCFQKIVPNLINRTEIVPGMLLARSHSTYRGKIKGSDSIEDYHLN